MWGISPIDQMLCRIKYRQAYYVGEFTPPTVNKPWIQYPGFNGGSDWGSIAYNPKNGILIANWSNTPMYNQLVARAKADQEGILPMDDPKFSAKKNGSIAAMAESPYAVNVQPFYAPITNVLCNEPPYGMVTAINMNTKKVIWQNLWEQQSTMVHLDCQHIYLLILVHLIMVGLLLQMVELYSLLLQLITVCMPLTVKLVSRSGVPNYLRVDKQHL